MFKPHKPKETYSTEKVEESTHCCNCENEHLCVYKEVRTQIYDMLRHNFRINLHNVFNLYFECKYYKGTVIKDES